MYCSKCYSNFCKCVDSYNSFKPLPPIIINQPVRDTGFREIGSFNPMSRTISTGIGGLGNNYRVDPFNNVMDNMGRTVGQLDTLGVVRPPFFLK